MNPSLLLQSLPEGFGDAIGSPEDPSLGGRVLGVELNHGQANEMGRQQLQEWEALTDRLYQPGEVRVLLTWSRRISSRGRGIFISGANVTERAGWSEEQIRQHVGWQRRLLGRLRRAPVLHIGLVDGVAYGWGTEFLLTCDLRLAGPQAEFSLPETGIGILPGAGGTSELWSLIGVNQALRLCLTGEKIGPAEAARIGLVEEHAQSFPELVRRAGALARMAARRSPTAIAACKSALLASVGASPERRAELESAAYELCLSSGDAAIGRASFKAITAGEEVSWGPRQLLTLP